MLYKQFDNKKVEWYDVVSILYDSKNLNFVYIERIYVI